MRTETTPKGPRRAALGRAVASACTVIVLVAAVSALATFALDAVVTSSTVVAAEATPAEGRTTTVRVAPDGEPGTPLVIEGRFVRGEEPVSGRTFEVYQTDDAGFYRERDGEDMGSAHARLRATFTTGADGRFRLETIRPRRYPRGGVPAHVHFSYEEAGEEREITLYFTPDPNLDADAVARLQSPGGGEVCALPDPEPETLTCEGVRFDLAR